MTEFKEIIWYKNKSDQKFCCKINWYLAEFLSLTWKKNVFIFWKIRKIFYFLIFQAKNKITQAYAAAKIIELTSEEDIEEHATEIDILAKCDHRNIVKLVDSILIERKLWILIEFCEGGALDDIIEKIDHGLSEEQVWFYSKISWNIIFIWI